MTGPSDTQPSIIRYPHVFTLYRAFQCFLFLAFLFLPRVGCATEIDTSTAGLTHTEYIRHALSRLAEEILAGIEPADRTVARFVVDDDDVGRHWVNTVFAEFRPSEETAHPITCRVSLLDYSLVEKTRHRFFGSLWVSRELRVGLTVLYSPALRAIGAREKDFARTYTGWFRASDLDRFRSGEFLSLSAPPASDFVSRWAGPVIVGAGLGLLTYLFFSIR